MHGRRVASCAQRAPSDATEHSSAQRNCGIPALPRVAGHTVCAAAVVARRATLWNYNRYERRARLSCTIIYNICAVRHSPPHGGWTPWGAQCAPLKKRVTTLAYAEPDQRRAGEGTKASSEVPTKATRRAKSRLAVRPNPARNLWRSRARTCTTLGKWPVDGDSPHGALGFSRGWHCKPASPRGISCQACP